MKILIIIMFGICCFFLGGGYIQAKEAKFGIEAKHDCNKCLAVGCQGKYCYTNINAIFGKVGDVIDYCI